MKILTEVGTPTLCTNQIFKHYVAFQTVFIVEDLFPVLYEYLI